MKIRTLLFFTNTLWATWFVKFCNVNNDYFFIKKELLQINCDSLQQIKVIFKHLCILALSRSTSKATAQSLDYLQKLVSTETNEDDVENKVNSDLDVVSQKNMNDMSLYERTPYGQIFCGKLIFV